jgi:hypothetical protein
MRIVAKCSLSVGNLIKNRAPVHRPGEKTHVSSYDPILKISRVSSVVVVQNSLNIALRPTKTAFSVLQRNIGQASPANSTCGIVSQEKRTRNGINLDPWHSVPRCDTVSQVSPSQECHLAQGQRNRKLFAAND